MRNTVINPSQTFILQALAKASDGLTKAEIEKKTGVSASTGNLGPVDLHGNLSAREQYKDSLRSLGYIKVHLEETADGEIARYHITSKGRKLAESCVAKRRVKEENKIPPYILDKAVLAIRSTRVYGLEDYTDADIKEIRESAGEQYASISVDDIRRQIVNRRKVGAFADPQEKANRLIKMALNAFGNEGTVIKGFLTEEQVYKLSKMLKKTA